MNGPRIEWSLTIDLRSWTVENANVIPNVIVAIQHGSNIFSWFERILYEIVLFIVLCFYNPKIPATGDNVVASVEGVATYHQTRARGWESAL